MIKKSVDQQRIDRKLSERKRWLINHEPICIFCLKPAGEGSDLCHKIRRSYSSSMYSREELQTMLLNTGLGHRDCHEIYDDKPSQAKHLPGIAKILREIEIIEPHYYQQIVDKFTL